MPTGILFKKSPVRSMTLLTSKLYGINLDDLSFSPSQTTDVNHLM
jgi:hypothetical protein